MHEDIVSIHNRHKSIGYSSELIEGEPDSANNFASIQALARKDKETGTKIYTGSRVTGFTSETSSGTIKGIETDKGSAQCEQVGLQ